MSQKFDLNLLRIFAVVYQQGSVTKAAEHLNLTQSAISNSLNRLKSNVGQELFNRTGRGVKPTRFAQDIYAQLEAPLQDIDTIMEGAAHFDLNHSHHFIVYSHETILHTLRQKLDQHLAGTLVEVLLVEIPSNEARIYDTLSNEKVDLVIDISPPQSAMFSSSVLKKEKLCCIVKHNHPRLNLETMSKENYLKERHAFFDLTRLNLKFVDWITDEVLPQRRAYSEHKSLLGMIEAVSYSDAVGVVPMSAAERYQKIFNLDLLPFPFANHSFNFYMVSLSKMRTNAANVWLRNLISQIVQ